MLVLGKEKKKKKQREEIVVLNNRCYFCLVTRRATVNPLSFRINKRLVVFFEIFFFVCTIHQKRERERERLCTITQRLMIDTILMRDIIIDTGI